jgi:hypothetical protein
MMQENENKCERVIAYIDGFKGFASLRRLIVPLRSADYRLRSAPQFIRLWD